MVAPSGPPLEREGLKEGGLGKEERSPVRLPWNSVVERIINRFCPIDANNASTRYLWRVRGKSCGSRYGTMAREFIIPRDKYGEERKREIENTWRVHNRDLFCPPRDATQSDARVSAHRNESRVVAPPPPPASVLFPPNTISHSFRSLCRAPSSPKLHKSQSNFSLANIALSQADKLATRRAACSNVRLRASLIENVPQVFNVCSNFSLSLSRVTSWYRKSTLKVVFTARRINDGKIRISIFTIARDNF